jgi:hypothetical protein
MADYDITVTVPNQGPPGPQGPAGTPAPTPIFKLKSEATLYDTDELVADPDLFFVAEANKNYAVELFLVIESGADRVDAKIATTNSPDVFGYWIQSDVINNSFSTTGAPITNRANIFGADTGEPAALLQKFTVIGPLNTNATITLEFANQSANETATIGAGSYLKAEIIS